MDSSKRLVRAVKTVRSEEFSAFRNHFVRTPVFRRRSSTARSWRSLAIIAGVRRRSGLGKFLVIVLCSAYTGPCSTLFGYLILAFVSREF